jgi:type 1 glutamine amidotransferase/glucose/arabinose dehydrogenase
VPVLIPLLLAVQTTTPDLAELEPGFSFRIYQAGYPLERVLEPLVDEVPNLDERRSVIDCVDEEGGFGDFDDWFVVVATTWLEIEEAGEYRFQTRSDDGSYLEIDGQRVVWNSGVHAVQSRDGAIDLDEGLHALRLIYFENEGGAALHLDWQPPGADGFELLTDSVARTEAGVTRVVAPGVKKFAPDLGSLTAGDGLALETAHPGWRVENLRPEGFEPKVGALGWLPDGRLGVATFDPKNNGVELTEPNGTLWALSNLDADDADAIVVEEVATGLYHPLGMERVGDDLFIAERDGIFRLRDADGDGTYETHELFAGGWISDNYHHFTFGPKFDGEYLHASLSTSIGSGGEDPRSGSMIGLNGPNPPHRGTWMRISMDESLSPEDRVEYLAGGFRTPNGILPLPDGTALIADNQGAWRPSSRIDHARPGHFYGHYNETHVVTASYPEGGTPALHSDRPTSPPALILPQGEISNSPSDIVAIENGPFAGQIYFSELKLGGVRRAFLEEVEGQMQGGVVRFCQGFEGGANRLLWSEDGSLIVGMTGEQASWSWRGTQFGLQRMVPTGGGAFEIFDVTATPTGFRMRFTEPVDSSLAADRTRFEARQWGYHATAQYGGAKRHEESVEVLDVRVSEDGFAVDIDLEGLEEQRCVWIRADLASARGERIWSPEVWYTLNRIPGRTLPETPPFEDRGVLVFSKTSGFRHDSIEEGAGALMGLCTNLGLPCDWTEDSQVFNDTTLAQYRVVVFLSTTGDILDLQEEAAFERWIGTGGTFVGVHAAADTEYDWPFYGEVVGAFFKSHPKVQPARIEVVDRDHPSTAHLPEVWTRTDEWYDYKAAPGDAFRVLMRLDEASYEDANMAAETGTHPIAWLRDDETARAYYTGGGHTVECFSEPDFLRHLEGALRWAARLDD